MGAQIREYRQRIRSVSATKKITRAMELIARHPADPRGRQRGLAHHEVRFRPVALVGRPGGGRVDGHV